MNGGLRYVALAASLMGSAGAPQALAQQQWEGVDKTVVEKVAAQAGRPARAPCIDLGEGDLQLFAFLLAGAAGGFVGGYCFRDLRARRENH